MSERAYNSGSRLFDKMLEKIKGYNSIRCPILSAPITVTHFLVTFAIDDKNL